MNKNIHEFLSYGSLADLCILFIYCHKDKGSKIKLVNETVWSHLSKTTNRALKFPTKLFEEKKYKKTCNRINLFISG